MTQTCSACGQRISKPSIEEGNRAEVEEFIDQFYRRQRGARIPTAEVVSRYRTYSMPAGDGGCLSPQMFGRVMRLLGYDTYRSSGVRYYTGIRLASDAELAERRAEGSARLDALLRS